MNRNDFALVGCGGAGNRLVDSIMNIDSKYIGYFINASKTDILSLDNYDDIAVNYFCISNQQNGMGRNRSLGKRFAVKSGMIMLDIINNFDQKTIYLATSFGGGSGSSIVSVLLRGIKQLKENGDFDKTVNLIGILPSLDSSEDILRNTLDTWNEILSYDCVDNMIFVDNNNTFNGQCLSEEEINERFATIFDSIFDIPNANGRNFDNGNLGKILNSKGCMYIYDLPNDCDNIEQALRLAEKNSVIAKMYKTKENTIMEDDIEKIKCSYIGTSFSEEEYKHEDILEKYKHMKEDFHGYNEENNLVLVSGCLPPFYSIQVIKAELDDRERINSETEKTDFSKFVIDYNNGTNEVASTKQLKESSTTQPEVKTKAKNKKKVMKKNLFDTFR